MACDDANENQSRLQLIKHLQGKLALAQAMAVNTSKKGSSANEGSLSSTSSNVILVPRPQRHFREVTEESIADASQEIQT